MRLNIYELFSVTAEGPLHLDATGYPVHLYSEDLLLMANCHGRDQIEAEHNAQLIAHCRNNFMKALAGLKNAEMIAQPCEQKWLRHLIKELEEA